MLCTQHPWRTKRPSRRKNGTIISLGNIPSKTFANNASGRAGPKSHLLHASFPLAWSFNTDAVPNLCSLEVCARMANPLHACSLRGSHSLPVAGPGSPHPHLRAIHALVQQGELELLRQLLICPWHLHTAGRWCAEGRGLSSWGSSWSAPDTCIQQEVDVQREGGWVRAGTERLSTLTIQSSMRQGLPFTSQRRRLCWQGKSKHAA